MTVASIRALHELLSNVPPATSSSCSSLTASGFWISSLILGFGWWCWLGWVGSAADLNWYRRERQNVLPNDDSGFDQGVAGVIVERTAGNIFELLVANGFEILGVFAHIISFYLVGLCWWYRT
jgi:hypothetical protein